MTHLLRFSDDSFCCLRQAKGWGANSERVWVKKLLQPHQVSDLSETTPAARPGPALMVRSSHSLHSLHEGVKTRHARILACGTEVQRGRPGT